MRPRLICGRLQAYGLCVRHTRHQSSCSRWSQKLSISASPNASKWKVLNEIKKYALRSEKDYPRNPDTAYGTAILASREFTKWLDDEKFMSNVLATLFMKGERSRSYHQDLDVLTGVVDALSPQSLSVQPRAGFSIILGPSESILPDLWDKEGFEGANTDSTSSVSFVANPLAGSTNALEFTLPLANTLFQNGRRSTLHACKWNRDGEGMMTITLRAPKTIQQIASDNSSADHTSSMIPLMPLTPPRKIVAGLGNIARQVEVDGHPTPASKELEEIVPRIFERRAQRDPTFVPQSIGVWCWVIPPHVMQSRNLAGLQLFSADSTEAETDTAWKSMDLFSELLSSGCRLHKILSGGGGWGAKQGLLSLDPETSFSLPGQDADYEMFIKSFEERNSASPTNGIVTPGSSLLFCAEPHWTDAEAKTGPLLLPAHGISLGVTPSLDQTPQADDITDTVDVSDDHFGASSANGLFIRGISDLGGIGVKDEESHGSMRRIMTKIDAPNAQFCI
ncbi:hypothetical protein F5Y18DRAFT_373116 [Xylariaceae sp. FL1019]|nr:hypothetical protein F5Y18DRAFT_373116 [Xylariaceae sp. FL1019]